MSALFPAEFWQNEVKLPTQRWREAVLKEKEQFAKGEITDDEMYSCIFYPDPFIENIEVALIDFIQVIQNTEIDAEHYSEIMEIIKLFILRLNDINYDENYDWPGIETGEREELCEFVDNVIKARGINFEELISLLDDDSDGDLTIEWRDW